MNEQDQEEEVALATPPVKPFGSLIDSMYAVSYTHLTLPTSDLV